MKEKKDPFPSLSSFICFGLFELFFLTPLIFYGWATTFSVTKETFAQIGFLVLTFIWVIDLFTNSSREKIKWILTSTFSLPVIIFGLILLVSLIWSKSLYASFISLGVWGCFFSVYFLTLWSVRDKKWVELLLIAVVGAGFIAAGYSILQFYGIELPIWRKVMGRMRLFSTFGNPNYLADYLAASLHLAVLLFLIQKRTKFFWLFVIATLYTSLILTYTRGAWVALFLSGIFVVILLFIYERKFLFNKRFSIILVLTVLASLTVIFSFPNPLNLNKRNIFKRSTSIIHLKSSASQRILIWSSAIEMIKEKPFLGTGVGNFGVYYPEAQGKFLSRKENKNYIPQTNRSTKAHNDYLQIWAETGILGIISFLTILIILYREIINFLKREKGGGLTFSSTFIIFFTGAISSFLIHATVSFPFHIVQNGMVFWLLFALTEKIIQKRINWEENKDESLNKASFQNEPSKPIGKLAWIFLILIGICIFYLSFWRIRIFLSDIHVKKAEIFIEAGFYSQARKELNRAIKINPYNAQAFADLTQADIYLGIYPEIIQAAKKARLNWNIAGIYNREAFAYLKLGKLNKAAKALDRCIFLYPNFAAGYINYGYLNLLKGERNIKKGNLSEAEKNLDYAFLFYVQGKIWKKNFNIPERLSLAYYGINEKKNWGKEWMIRKIHPPFLFYCKDNYFMFILKPVARLDNDNPFNIILMVYKKGGSKSGRKTSDFSLVVRIKDKQKLWWDKKITNLKLSTEPVILEFNVKKKLYPGQYTIFAELRLKEKPLYRVKRKFAVFLQKLH